MNTLHLISHTHWDREWHQTFQQFRLRLVHLIDGLLDILDTDPQYKHFMLDGQTIVLEDYLQIRPEREADLRKYVQNGRILIGPWYLMPDEFLVSPEAIIRNFQEGDRVAKHFGPKMMVGYIPDPFGHIGQMPQILRGFDIQTASLWRGVQDSPNEFWWQSPDGSRVLMGYLCQGYGNAAGILGNGPEAFVTMAGEQARLLAARAAGEHLLLMHGVDHQEAHPGTSAAVAYAEGRLEGSRLIHSTLPAYFDCVQASPDLDKLPVVTGELRSSKHAPMLPGVLSARMWIKQRNRACETLLEKWAEPFSAWAQAVCGNQLPPESLRHPEAVLRQAWRLLLQCHPHDSICGCSIDQVHEEMRPRFDQAEQMGEEITRQSLVALAGAIDTRSTAPVPAASAVVVFNPTGGPRTDVVSLVIQAPSESGAFDLVDENGVPVPYQSEGIDNGQVDMNVDRETIQMGINMISPGGDFGFGRALGMRVLHEATSDANEVTLEILTGQTGEPDLEQWERARQEILPMLEDPAVQNFHLMIHSNASSQVRFTAREVPCLGYRTYWVREKARSGEKTPDEKAEEEQAPIRISPLARALMPVAARLAAKPAAQKLVQRLRPDPAARPPYIIENEFLAVEARPDGSLDIRDKRSGAVYRGQNRFVDGGDRGDTYNYSPPATDRLVPARLNSARVERGAVQQTLELHLVMVAPEALSEDRKARGTRGVVMRLTSQVTLTAGVPRVDIHTEIDNKARDHRLRVHFAAPFAVQEADYDGHFEVVRRPVDVPAYDESWSEQPRPEVPQRAFTAISDGQNGLLVANRGLPEVEVLRLANGRSEVAVTLLRCVGWLSRDDIPERKGAAGPTLATPGAQMPGKWAFDYAVIPFPEDARLQAYHQAYAFQTPLRAVTAALHAGRMPVGQLPAVSSFLQVEPEEFTVSAVQTAGDGSGWIMRGYNLIGKPATVRVQTSLPCTAVSRVNLLDEHLETLTPASDQAIELEVKGHELVSVRFDQEKPLAQV